MIYGIYRFDDAEVEPTGVQSSSGFRPDVLLIRKGSTLYVEVAVTHEVDYIKEGKVSSVGRSMVEISLCRLTAADLSQSDLDSYILEKSPRRWIHNNSKDSLNAKALSNRDSRRALSMKRIQAMAESHVIRPVPAEHSRRHWHQLRECDLLRAVGLPCRYPHWFRYSERDWQSLYLARLFFNDDNPGSGTSRILTRYSLGDSRTGGLPESDSQYCGFMPRYELEAFFNFNLIEECNRHKSEYGSAPPGIGHPNLALIDYQKQLASLGGIIQPYEADRFVTDEDLEAKIFRRRRLFALLYSIVQSGDPGWKRGVISKWVSADLDGYSDVPLELSRTGGKEWEYLEQRLIEISRLHRGGGPVADTMGLPIHKVNKAALEAHNRLFQRFGLKR